MLGTRVAVRSAPACSAHAPLLPSTRVPNTFLSACMLGVCVLTACREHSQVPLACRLRAGLCVLRTRVPGLRLEASC
eukprot:6144814-Alexandrium_andersonii.AAC.1